MTYDKYDLLPWPNNQNSAELAGVVRMMAWAVRHQRPLDQAVNSLIRTQHGGTLWSQIVATLRLPLPASALRSWLGVRGHEKRVRLTAEALHHGDGPAVALQAGFRHRVPTYVFESLAEAERSGRLPETLQVIADQLEQRVTINFQCTRAFDFALIYLIPMFVVSGGFMVFVLPKFKKVAEEMGVAHSYSVVEAAFLTTPFGMVWALLLFWSALGLVRTAGRSSDAITARIPGIGRYVKDVGKQAAASAMQAALMAGHGTEAAAAICERTLDSAWTRSRLRQFGRELNDGTPWVEAWAKAGLSNGLDNLLLQGAALQEDPAAGFGRLVALQRDRLNRTARITGRAVSLGMTAAAATVAGFLATDVFRILVQIVDAAGSL